MGAPVATYRIQLQTQGGFEGALTLVDYLDALGVSHAYVSPYAASEPGSTHGYDTIDASRIDPRLGTERMFNRWLDALRARGMGHIVDFVPNHMGIGGGRNAWWNDVLENGACSLYADRFDIEWNPPKQAMRGRVLMPSLGAQYGEALERGELALERDGGAFRVRYYEHRFPISPSSIAPLLERAAKRLGARAGDVNAAELASIVTAIHHLPATCERSRELREERAREKEIIKRRIAALCASSAEIAAAIDAEVQATNGRPGEPSSFDALDELLRAQSYRLAFWRVATEEINYRRFFDINALAAIRTEIDEVFEATHALVLSLVREGKLDGIRLDHTDGLYDPTAYFARLQARAEAPRPLSPDKPLYLVAEKILEPGEKLPRDWRVHGTTGYDFLAATTGLFVDRDALRAMTEIYRDATGDHQPFAEHAAIAKRAIMRSSLAAEVSMLAQRLERLADASRRSRDFTYTSLRAAIVETIASFGVYRTYVRPDGAREPDDDAHVERAIRRAKKNNPEMSRSIFDFLRDVLLLRMPDDAPERAAAAELAMRFQQITGPVMAKAVEDTAFYTYVRLVALNEVGASPDRFGVPIASWHEQNQERLRDFPLSLTATSTHDTKRGEDVRARLCVLTEMPDAWRDAVRGWRGVAEAHATTVDDEPAPSPTDEYLFYQTVIGAWPLHPAEESRFAERVGEYMQKAAREAKRRTSWVNPNEAYEEALRSFVRAMMHDERFVESARAFALAIAPYGAANGLAQTLLKIAAPGVPDTYQGSEVWNLSLVDPDNRRVVTYAPLRRKLEELAMARGAPGFAATLRERFRDGGVKLFVTHVALRLRRAMPALFLEGEYAPIDAGDHVVAFARLRGDAAIVCAAARHSRKKTEGRSAWAIGSVWGDERLPLPQGGRWRDVLTERVIVANGDARLAQVFRDLPVALLLSEGR